MQRKNQLVSEKVMKSKVCKPREGRLTCYLDRLVQSALTNYCKKDLFGCTKSMIIILYFTITPDKNKKVLFKSILLKLLKLKLFMVKSVNILWSKRPKPIVGVY